MTRPVSTAGLEVLVFEIGQQRYGVPAADVRELLRAVASVPLPGAPPVVEGIINLRGAVVPVLDLRHSFQLTPKPPHPDDHLVVARAGRYVVALRVDRAVDLVRLDPSTVQSTGGFLPASVRAPSAATLPEGLLLIPDLAALLPTDSQPLAEALLRAETWQDAP